jgi:hypothetical protein
MSLRYWHYPEVAAITAIFRTWGWSGHGKRPRAPIYELTPLAVLRVSPSRAGKVSGTLYNRHIRSRCSTSVTRLLFALSDAVAPSHSRRRPGTFSGGACLRWNSYSLWRFSPLVHRPEPCGHQPHFAAPHPKCPWCAFCPDPDSPYLLSCQRSNHSYLAR